MSASATVLNELVTLTYDAYVVALHNNAPKQLIDTLHSAYLLAVEARTNAYNNQPWRKVGA